MRVLDRYRRLRRKRLDQIDGVRREGSGRFATDHQQANHIFSTDERGHQSRAIAGTQRDLVQVRQRFLLQRLAFGGMVSVALSFAGTVSQMLWLRLLLALLAGGMLTIAYALASQVIPENERAAAFGLLSSFAMLGGAAGPVFGGLLTSLSIPLVFATDAAAFGLLFGLAYRCINNDHFSSEKTVA